MISAQGRIRLLVGNTGSDEQFLVDNTIVSCKRDLRAGAGLVSNTINSLGNNDLVFQRNGSTAITLKPSNEVQFSGYLILSNVSARESTDLALRRDDIEFILLFKEGATLAEAITRSKQLRAHANTLVNQLQINQFPVVK